MKISQRWCSQHHRKDALRRASALENERVWNSKILLALELMVGEEEFGRKGTK